MFSPPHNRLETASPLAPKLKLDEASHLQVWGLQRATILQDWVLDGSLISRQRLNDGHVPTSMFLVFTAPELFHNLKNPRVKSRVFETGP